MSGLVAPRYELPITDKDGRITREWYKFLVQLANANGTSLTTTDDLQDFQNMDSAGAEALALIAANRARAIDGQFLIGDFDKPVRPDNDLLAFWPGNAI